ncbi:hypothetical protein B0A54_10449 [Friedmanniomyces endolithicus]|uniref:DUF7603 domain-containing protein n=1 Tax=Friedmanniomyces endolithicus TaxID=329885 RepID=A0A4U0UTV0_9PEZI|nr:hypothetical protein LTS09_012489 [Friedmanniomyces endolithicus]TKA39430.1 hypothetical protein B0A54_10449 [Friedmanniomyces endolithicus]
MAHSRDSSFADAYYTSSPTREDVVDDYADHSGYYAREQQQPQAVRPQTTLAQIHIPSFRSFASSIPVPSPKARERKPAPFQLSTRSPRAASFSLAERASPRLAEPTSRPLSLDSPLLPQSNGLAGTVSPPQAGYGNRASYPGPTRAHTRTVSIDSRLAGGDSPSSYNESPRSSIPIHTKYAQEQIMSHAPKQSVSSSMDLSDYTSPEKGRERTSMHIPQAPSMTLQYDAVKRTLSEDSLASEPRYAREQRPKLPGGRLGSFFGWKSSSQRSGTESPTTTFSDRSLSPLPSPRLLKPVPALLMDGSTSTARLTPPGLDINKANARTSVYFDNPDTPILLGSIRREMDLEDELDRVRAEMPTLPATETARRTSDYFSDSGTSSVRYPVSDPDARLEQMEHKLRKVEQEKAQIKVEVASTMQAELARRRDLEQMVRDLEDNLYKRAQEDEERNQANERMFELEASLDEAKRRLSQERQAKDSFGDLYSATKLELEQHRNERDNLRDDVLPQLRSRVKGLETDGADTQALVSENTRLQQELAVLAEEMQKIQGTPRFSSIAEEGDSSPGSQWGTLSRSNSQARTRAARGGSVTRSGSVKERAEGGRHRSGSVGGSAHPVSTEGVKEIEDQRDALHKALKLLISRYEKQRRDHELAVKKLTSAKAQAEQGTPRRTGYYREVSFLKEEVVTLRKRTEDALEQKWEYEKGLSGVKMDLDRTEQETRGLKDLLQEHDVFASGRRSLSSTHETGKRPEHPATDGIALSVSAAEGQRDHARQVAAEYRHRAASAHPNDSHELLSSAQRMDALADELDEQMRANAQLRLRLASAVVKGEQEQKASTHQIEEMQLRLAGMEDSVLAAQQHSETVLTNHESEVRRIEESSSPALLQRLRISIPEESRKLSPSSPLLLTRSPRMMKKTPTLSETSLLETSRTQILERKVRELEGLLREAEDDVQVVVQRVTRSQLEVMELQTERDAALVQMRKLQGLFVEERERAEGLLGR